MIALALIALAVWLYLLLARGAFWRCSERDDWQSTQLPAWPAVAAVVPARNEADCIGASIASLFAQELKTPVPVSAKRLAKLWETLRR